MSEVHHRLHPSHWREPKGYANGVAATGRVLYLGGQIGWNANQEFESDDFVQQTEQTLQNIVAILREGGAGPEHLVRLTWFAVDIDDYLNNLRAIGKSYVNVIGRHYPAMSLVQVVRLVEVRARVEIEATAVLP
ncbi:MAG: enamine deaminase RidA [Gammaproteobacteria bacterium]|nr:enamine deaminase RidA [Gammaproteobacteria bacterium]